MAAVAVVGCGIGGMAAALFLARAGHRVVIFERFDRPGPIGAGLLLQPTGLAALARLGLDAPALALGARVDGIYGRTSRGTVVYDISYADLAPHLFGLGVHRGTLFTLLHDAVHREGIAVRPGVEIADVRQGADWAEPIAASGLGLGRFDLVVAADGSASILRRRCGGKASAPIYPWGAVWGIAADARGAFQGILRQRFGGAKLMMGVLPVGRLHRDEGTAQVALFWSLRGDAYQAWRDGGLAAWHEAVGRLWPETLPLVAQFHSPDDLTWARYRDVRMRRWRMGRLVFLGDAAHGTTPQLGQGANLALLDAMTLRDVLAGGTDDAALDAFERERRRHVLFYQRASRWLTPFFQSDLALLGRLRDAAFGRMGGVPALRRMMAATLAGVQLGPFRRLDPGGWAPAYGLREPSPASPVPAAGEPA